jgi:hypothetical protein
MACAAPEPAEYCEYTRVAYAEVLSGRWPFAGFRNSLRRLAHPVLQVGTSLHRVSLPFCAGPHIMVAAMTISSPRGAGGEGSAEKSC